MNVTDEDGHHSWPYLVGLAEAVRARLAAAGGSAVIAPVLTGGQLVTVLLATRDLACPVVLVGPAVDPPVTATRPARWLVVDPAEGTVTVGPGGPVTGGPATAVGGGLWVLSSGTTGQPVASRWDWPTLTRGADWGRGAGERWAIGYVPYGFAGVHATCQALGRAGGIEFVRPEQLSGDPCLPPLDVVAGTPSFWRMAAIRARRGAGPPRAVGTASTGGEPVDAALLGTIRTTFHPRRIKQIFATTEFGPIATIDDGLPGLPAASCRRRAVDGPAYAVRGDRLVVSPGPGRPYRETGDLVRVDGDRIHVLGRRGTLINVGGHKVDPAVVTRVLQEHPRVLAARAYGVPSQLLGSVVAAEVVVSGPAGPATVAELKRYARRRLTPPESPRRIRLTEDLAVAPSGKVSTVE